MIFLLFFFFPLFSKEFVLFTEPKSGTHLLIPILEELTGKKVYWAPEYYERAVSYSVSIDDPNHLFFSLRHHAWTRQIMDEVWKKNQKLETFLHLHAPYSTTLDSYLEEKQCMNFFVQRDPRDLIISLLNHYKNIDFSDKEVKMIPTDEERLLFLIQNKLRKQTLAFMGWKHSKNTCVLEFSKLMGSHGGAATDAEADSEMQKIASWLGIKSSRSRLKAIYRRNFGKGWNFFRGKVGVWREIFTEEHKRAAKEAIGDLLIELGYEQDDQW